MQLRRHATTLLLLAASLVVAATVRAESPACDDPANSPGNCLPWGFNDLGSELVWGGIHDLSKDGSAIAGSSSVDGVITMERND